MDIIDLRKKEKKAKNEIITILITYGIAIILAGVFLSFTIGLALFLFLVGLLFFKNKELKKIRQNIEFEKSMQRYKQDVKLH